MSSTPVSLNESHAGEHARAADEAESPRRWTSGFTWGAFLVLAFTIYETTHNPELAIVVFCLKFGMDDALNGLWLSGRDHRPSHRLPLILACYALGSLRAAVAAGFVTAGLLSLSAMLGAKKGFGINAALGSFLLTLGAFFVSAVFSGLTVFFGGMGRARLWLDSELTGARHRGEFPPESFAATNHLHALALPLLLSTSLLSALLSFRQGPLWAIVIPLALTTSVWMLLRKVLARDPNECWPESDWRSAMTTHGDSVDDPDENPDENPDDDPDEHPDEDADDNHPTDEDDRNAAGTASRT
jgi:hypothetical protein